MHEAMLYEHDDGRQAVSFVVPAPFSDGDPKWHRVGPVAVYGFIAPIEAREVELALRAVDLPHKLGPAYCWEDLWLAFETGAAVAANTKSLSTTQSEDPKKPEVALVAVTRDGAGNIKAILAEEAMDAAIDAAIAQTKESGS